MTADDNVDVEADESPPWLGTPDDETGAVVPVRIVIFQDSETAITATGLVAYSKGLAMTLTVLRRVDDVLRLIEFGGRPPASEKALTLEIEYADGRRASNSGLWFDGGSADIRLTGGGGGGGGTSYRSSYWAWPLPPPGPVKLGVAWGSIDLPMTEVEIDAQPIVDAAALSERPWG
jgi:hypothetical protein